MRSIFVLILLLAAASSAAAEQPLLTLPEAQRLAAGRSRQLSAQDSATAASRDMAVAAGQLPDPTLKFGVDNLPVDGPDQFNVTRDFMTMRRVGIVQEFTSGEKRQLRAQRFEREAEKFTAEKTATTAAIYRDTALAWLDRYYATAMASAVAEQIGAARLEVESAESAYRAGRGSQADVFEARSAAVMLEDRASEIDRRIRTATTTLARWIGAAAERPLGGKPDIGTIPFDPKTLDEHLAHHPQIAILAKQAEIATTEARLAEANRKSDWSVELMYSQRGPAYSSLVSVGVAIPLQWDQKSRQDRELAAKLAMVDQAEAQRDEALRAHVAEARSMIQEWQSGRERRARYERELLPLAGERTRAVLAAYRGGKSSLNDVLAARRSEIEVRLQALQLELETARLWAQVNFLLPEDSATKQASGGTYSPVPLMGNSR